MENEFEEIICNTHPGRGYDYYCENAVENIDVTVDSIRADVIGTEDYEVEISLSNGKVTDMCCSCPYAEDGSNCKHMVAVLYEWSEGRHDENSKEDEETDEDIFGRPSNMEEYRKKPQQLKSLFMRQILIQ